MAITSIKVYKTIPDYPLYEIDLTGSIRRVYNSKKAELTLSLKNGEYIVELQTVDGIRKTERVHRLMQRTYLPPPKHGEILYFKNGNKQDIHLDNLAYIQRTELGKITNASKRRKPVAKISANGELLDIFPSARQAAKANYMSDQTVMNHCNGKVQSTFAPDGNRYVWDEELEYSQKIYE